MTETPNHTSRLSCPVQIHYPHRSSNPVTQTRQVQLPHHVHSAKDLNQKRHYRPVYSIQLKA